MYQKTESHIKKLILVPNGIKEPYVITYLLLFLK